MIVVSKRELKRLISQKANDHSEMKLALVVSSGLSISPEGRQVPVRNHLRIKHYEALKADVRRVTVDCDSHSAKLKLLMEMIRSSLSSDSEKEHLRRLVLIIAAFLSHAECGDLTHAQLKKLISIAQTSLQILDIKPGKSKFSLVYGEFYFARAIVFANRGDQWQAAWHQELGFELATGNSPGNKSFQLYVSGMRYWRIGHVREAIRMFENSTDPSAEAARRNQTQLLLARSYRVLGQFDTARNLLNHIPPGVSERVRREVEWEEALISTINNKDGEQIRRLVKKQKTHDKLEYIIESYLLAVAIGDKRTLHALNKMRYIGRKYRRQNLGYDFQIAKMIEEADNPEFPDFRRFEIIEEILSSLSQSTSLDIELFARASTVRVLKKMNSQRLLNLAKLEYFAFNRKISSGASKDTLDLLGEKERPMKLTA